MARAEHSYDEVWSSLLIAHAVVVREIERALLGQTPLSIDEYDLLLVIQRGPGQRLRYAELASATIYTRSGISRIARRMEQRGYLRRESCPTDRRGAFAGLTAQGERALQETWKVYRHAIDQLFGRLLSPDEAGQLAAGLSSVCDRMVTQRLVPITGKADKKPKKIQRVR